MTVILDATQLAEALGTHPETIRRATRDGSIPYHKIGSTIRYTLADVLKATAVDRHPDDEAVDKFAAAMHARMAEKRAEGKDGWDDPALCTDELLEGLLDRALLADKWVDVANYAMMLWARGAK